MAVLASLDALGGLVGDTFQNLEITRVISDGNYIWDERATSGLNEVRIDASAAAYAETLAAATGSGQAVLYHLVDKTNATTITPAAGEQIAPGAVDQAFDFAAYVVGTRFLLTDRAAGVWDISVVGASEQTDLHRCHVYQAGETAGTSDVNSNPLDLGHATLLFYDPDGMVDVANDKIVIQQGGTYRVTSSLNGGNAAEESNSILVNGLEVASAAVRTDRVHGPYVAYTGALSAGDEITFVQSNGSVDHVNVSVEQLPATEAVLAGFVPTEALGSVHLIPDTGTDVSTVVDNGGNRVPFNVMFASEGSAPVADLATGKVTLEAGKRYRVFATAHVAGTAQGGIYDFTNGVYVSPVQNTSDSLSLRGGWTAIVAPTSEIQVGFSFVASETVTAAANQYSSFLVEVLPTSTVVDPEGLVPQQLSTWFATDTAADPINGLPVQSFSVNSDDYGVVGSPINFTNGNPTSDGSGLTDDGSTTVTVQTAGKYRISANYNLDGSGNNSLIGQILVNGAIVSETGSRIADTNNSVAMSCEAILNLSPGDTIQFAVHGQTVAGVQLAAYSVLVEQLPTQHSRHRRNPSVFSTTEQQTDRTWIDGKPVYERGYAFASLANGSFNRRHYLRHRRHH